MTCVIDSPPLLSLTSLPHLAPSPPGMTCVIDSGMMAETRVVAGLGSIIVDKVGPGSVFIAVTLFPPLFYSRFIVFSLFI